MQVIYILNMTWKGNKSETLAFIKLTQTEYHWLEKVKGYAINIFKLTQE